MKKRLKELFGSSKHIKCLYCWSWKPETRKFAKKLGITPVSFSEIINYLLKRVKEHKGWLYLKDYPNLMLLQFLQAEGYFKKDVKTWVKERSNSKEVARGMNSLKKTLNIECPCGHWNNMTFDTVFFEPPFFYVNHNACAYPEPRWFAPSSVFFPLMMMMSF